MLTRTERVCDVCRSDLNGVHYSGAATKSANFDICQSCYKLLTKCEYQTAPVPQPEQKSLFSPLLALCSPTSSETIVEETNTDDEFSSRFFTTFLQTETKNLSARKMECVVSPFSFLRALCILLECTPLQSESYQVIKNLIGKSTPLNLNLNCESKQFQTFSFLLYNTSDLGQLESNARDKLRALTSNFDFLPINTSDLQEAKKKFYQVNKKVDKITNQLIPTLLSDDLLHNLSSTALILGDAFYFKQKWLYPFDARLTCLRTFFFTPTSSMSIKTMMHRDAVSLPLYESSTLQFTELKYTEEGSLLLFMPSDLAGFLKSFSLEKLRQDVIQKARRENIRLILPTFEIKCQHELLQTLKQMGGELLLSTIDLRRAFCEQNSLVFLFRMFQKLVLKVNEEGTEAAVATVMMMSKGCSTRKKEKIVAFDHPFVYILQYQEKPLLMGVFDGYVSSSK